jgi:hypothetical protein
VFRRKQLDRDLDEELQAYVELVAAEKVRTGLDPGEAYCYARRQTGGIDQVVERVRDVPRGGSDTREEADFFPGRRGNGIGSLRRTR